MDSKNQEGKVEDRVALVTGGAQGIGMRICQRFLKSGMKVAVFDLIEKKQAQIAELSETQSKNIFFFKVDVTDFEAVKQAVDKAIDKLSHIDILVNNAGITRDKLILRMKEEDWDSVIRVNLKGAFNCIRAVSPYMLRRRKGKVVNISSIIGLRGNAGQANYAASKAGLLGLTKSCAREFAPRGITVNAVAPGFIQTRMTEKLMRKEESKKLISQIPLGKVGSSEDVARVVEFLSSNAASYVTGEVIRVDGGLSM